MRHTLKKYESFHQMEDEQLAYMASLTPEQCLINLKAMVLSAYGSTEDVPIDKMERKINLHPR